MRIALIVALSGVGGALGGCVRPPPPVALHNRAAYRGVPAPPPVVAGDRPVRPNLPLPVPPEPVSAAAAAAAACAGRPGNLPEARKEQLFKDFTQWESHKPTTATVASAPPPSPGEPPVAAACGPAP